MAAFSEEEFLRLGFEAQGDFSWSISKRENQIKNFRSLYGTSPKILSIIWAEIQSTGSNETSAKPLHMLLLYRWMKSNQSENELKSCFGGISVRTIRKWRRILVVQVANLRTTKIDSNWNNTNGLLRGRTTPSDPRASISIICISGCALLCSIGTLVPRKATIVCL